MGKNGREERVRYFYLGEERPRCLRWWRGALNGDWLRQAVSLRGWVLACAVCMFWRDADGQRWQDRHTASSSHLNVQVFDGGRGGLTGKGAGAAAPVECWGGVELACVNEINRG
jgi:hypothetical protein